MSTRRRRVVNGRLVEFAGGEGLHWRRVLLLTAVLAVLIVSNPAHQDWIHRHAGPQLSGWLHRSVGGPLPTFSSYWKRRTTNYGLFAVKEQIMGIKLGFLWEQSWECSEEDVQWGGLCRGLRESLCLKEDPWRLPHDRPALVVYRLGILLCFCTTCWASCATTTIFAGWPSALTSLFVPSTRIPFWWMWQVISDSNMFLFPALTRLHELTLAQATTSFWRVSDDDKINFYAAFGVLIATAILVQGTIGRSNRNGWAIIVATLLGYLRGTQGALADSWVTRWMGTPADEQHWEMVAWTWARCAMLFATADSLWTLAAFWVANLVGAALGEDHFGQQVWQVWSQSIAQTYDETVRLLFGGTRL
jgi:hypothetical protein